MEWSERGLTKTPIQSDNIDDDFDLMYLTGVSYEEHLERPEENSEQCLSDMSHIAQVILETSPKELEVREIWWKKLLVDTENAIYVRAMEILEPGGETAENHQALEHARQVRDNLRFAITRARLVLAEVPPDLTDQNIPTQVSERIKSLVLHVIKDYFEDLQPDDKLLRVTEMGVGDMLQLGWSSDCTALIQQYKPHLQRLKVEVSWMSEVLCRGRAVEEAQRELTTRAGRQMQNNRRLPERQHHHAPSLVFSFTKEHIAQAKQIVYTLYREFDGIRESSLIS